MYPPWLHHVRCVQLHTTRAKFFSGSFTGINCEWVAEKGHISESDNKKTEILLFAWTTIARLVPVAFAAYTQTGLSPTLTCLPFT